MGSPDPVHGRQLNGMGGGVSSLSKVCVVGPPAAAQRARGADVEYTFIQVGIREPELDYSGNCGNLSSMIGVFAVDEGLCAPRLLIQHSGGEGGCGMQRGVVRAYNTNTEKLVDTTFSVAEMGEGGWVAVLDLPEVEMAGVPGLASRIDLDFADPAGARTGKLLPTSKPIDALTLSFKGSEKTIRASLVDATNPTVFVLAEDLAEVLDAEDVNKLVYTERRVEECVEAIRQAGALAMGLDPTAKAQPKIAVLSAPPPSSSSSSTGSVGNCDIVVHAYSMGVLHKAVPMTLGLCLGVAARTEGTLAHALLSGARVGGETATSTEASDGDLIRIAHPSGVVAVGATFSSDGQVKSAKVVRTGRRLMKGVVYC